MKIRKNKQQLTEAKREKNKNVGHMRILPSIR